MGFCSKAINEKCVQVCSSTHCMLYNWKLHMIMYLDSSNGRKDICGYVLWPRWQAHSLVSCSCLSVYHHFCHHNHFSFNNSAVESRQLSMKLWKVVMYIPLIWLPSSLDQWDQGRHVPSMPYWMNNHPKYESAQPLLKNQWRWWRCSPSMVYIVAQVDLNATDWRDSC